MNVMMYISANSVKVTVKVLRKEKTLEEIDSCSRIICYKRPKLLDRKETFINQRLLPMKTMYIEKREKTFIEKRLTPKLIFFLRLYVVCP